MKQYIKNRPIKWGFKCWYSSDSETGYVYQSELYQGRKEKRELNLASSVVRDLCQDLKDTYCHNFFNSLTLVQNLYDNGLYHLGTASSYRILMQKGQRNEARRLTMQILQPYSLVQPWYDNKSMILRGSHLEK